MPPLDCGNARAEWIGVAVLRTPLRLEHEDHEIAARSQELADAVAERALGEAPPVDDLERLMVVCHDGDDLPAELQDAVEVVEVDVRREQDRVQHGREFRHDDPAGDPAEFVHVDDVPIDRRLRHPDPGGHVHRRERGGTLLAEDRRRLVDDLVTPTHDGNRTAPSTEVRLTLRQIDGRLSSVYAARRVPNSLVVLIR